MKLEELVLREGKKKGLSKAKVGSLALLVLGILTMVGVDLSLLPAGWETALMALVLMGIRGAQK